jgi:hypothetical protein
VSAGGRLATFLTCAVVGAGIAVLGSTTTWYRTTSPGRDISSSAGTIHVSGAVKSYSPGDLGSALPPIAIISLVLAVLAFLVGPRVRGVLVALVAAGGIGVIALGLALRFTVVVQPGSHVESGTGRLLALIGAVVAVLGAGLALPTAGRVRRVGMPESGPKEGG